MTTFPLSTTTAVSGSIWRSRTPFGPSARTRPSATCTFTPAGTGIGSLPIRDMIDLPHRADDLAADVLTSGDPVGQDTFRRRQHVHPEPAAHRGDLVDGDIDAEARTAHAPEPGDHRAPLSVVTKVEAEDVPRGGVDHAGAGEVALVDEHAGDCLLVPRPRNVDGRLAGGGRVPDAGEHVRDRVGHHGRITSSP